MTLYILVCKSLEKTQHRRLADGDVHCAASATYQIFFRFLTLTNHITL